MAKNLRNLFLASAMTAAVVLAGCGHFNNHNGQNEKKQPKQGAYNPDDIEKQKKTYYQHVWDSVATANGAKEIETERLIEEVWANFETPDSARHNNDSLQGKILESKKREADSIAATMVAERFGAQL